MPIVFFVPISLRQGTAVAYAARPVRIGHQRDREQRHQVRDAFAQYRRTDNCPNFIEKIKRLRRGGVEYIEMTTNALYLHKIGIDTLLSDGPDVINISFAGFDKDMYERDFRVKHYERTRDNILGLLRENQKLGALGY